MKRGMFVLIAFFMSLLCACKESAMGTKLEEYIVSSIDKNRQKQYEKRKESGKFKLNDEKYIFRDYKDSLVKAIDSKDKKFLIQLIGKNILDNKNSEIEKEADALFSAYKGKSCFVYSSELFAGHYSTESGMQKRRMDGDAIIFTDDDVYFLDLSICYRDDEDKKNVGINKITLRNLCFEAENKEKSFAQDLKTISVGVMQSDGTKYCIANGNAYCCTAYDRFLKKEQFEDFIKETQSLDDFVNVFGEPSFKDMYVFYELSEKDEYGKSNFVRIYSEEGRIISMALVSSVKWLEMLYDSKI